MKKCEMFCYQCQETARGTGCTKVGVCGKRPELSSMLDLLIYVTKGLSCVTTKLREEGKEIGKDVNHIRYSSLDIGQLRHLDKAVPCHRSPPFFRLSSPRMLSRRRSGGTTPESAGRFPAAPLSVNARTETQALRRSEIPLVQIARFVRGVYFALKRRGLLPAESILSAPPGRLPD